MKTFSMPPADESLREIDCPLCGGRKFRRFWECDGFRFVRCVGCALIYQNPRPRRDALIERYGDEYFTYERENEARFFRLMTMGLADIDFDSRTAALRGEDRTFLDVGCATGMLIARMREQGFRAQGVEVCRPAARFGIEERRLDIRVGTLEDARFAESSFGVVHSSHLIEHLADPDRFVCECARVLIESGLLIITTPNAAGLQPRLFGARWRSAIADHMVLFTRKTLGRLLEKHGFTVRAIKTWGGLAVGLGPRWLKRPLDLLAKRFGFGDVMIVVAVRAGSRRAS